jgi:hypothetical protein
MVRIYDASTASSSSGPAATPTFPPKPNRFVRDDDESVPALLQPLDEVLGKAMHQGVVTNEINGRIRLVFAGSTRAGSAPKQEA